MTLFVDTTAFYALIDADDAQHAEAAAAWRAWLQEGASFVTSNYTIVECWALLQSRLGLAAVRVFQEELLPVVQVEWVTQPMHDVVVRIVLASEKRGVSLVDRVSFEVMRRRGIAAAFAFDRHFATEGFTVLPQR